MLITASIPHSALLNIKLISFIYLMSCFFSKGKNKDPRHKIFCKLPLGIPRPQMDGSASLPKPHPLDGRGARGVDGV